MTFFWFGDSWVYGDELDRNTSTADWKELTFASLVSKFFNANCVNLGVRGSSLDDLPLAFHKIVSDLHPTDRVFFCLTANHRMSFFDDQGKLRRILPTPAYEIHNPHPYSQQWYKFFDSPDQRTYNQDKTCNLLYLWCQYLNVPCYFANIFTRQSSVLIDIIPEKNWIIGRESCLASSILPLIDNQNLFLDDNPLLTNEQWNQQRPAVEKYIRPNFQHPNAAGHAKIAQLLIDKLQTII